MPDFRLQPNFPVSTVIDAAGRNAQLQQQAQQAGQQQLIQGLQAIGQVGQSLYDTRKQVAQSLALGRQLEVPDEVARNMAPEQILQVGALKKGQVDMHLLMSMIHPGAFPPADAATPASGTPQPKPNGAMLTSGTTVTPMPDANSPASVPPPAQPLTPPAQSMPVPISAPPARPMVNKATSDAAIKLYGMSRPENVYTNDNGTLTPVGQIPKGSKVLPSKSTTDTNQKEQDAYWRDGVRGLQSIRGDTALKDIESQRNSAIVAYNRLKDIELTGKTPNPIDYIDILGQVYKARTGASPTKEVLEEAKQQTAQGKFGKYWTYFTGQQMPATSKDIANSLKDMVGHMGLQADELHDGYMQVHGSQVFNPNMSPENVAKLSKISRGKTFQDATGIKPEDFDPHLQAIKWAQSNPNDPRSAPILQKAMQAKQGAGGNLGI